MELALYSLSRAVESFALCLAEWGWVRHHHVPKRLDIVIFSLATAVIMHCYAQVCERVCILLLSSEAFLKFGQFRKQFGHWKGGFGRRLDAPGGWTLCEQRILMCWLHAS